MAASTPAVSVLALQLGLAGISPGPGVSDGLDPAALAGVWEGGQVVREARGNCGLNDPRNADGREPVTLTVRAADDGSLSATLAFLRRPATVSTDWTGRIDGDRVRFEMRKLAACGDAPQRYVVKPAGELPQMKDGRTELRLRAADDGCGCFFSTSTTS